MSRKTQKTIARGRRALRRAARKLVNTTSDQRKAGGRWYRMENEADAYWTAKRAAMGLR